MATMARPRDAPPLSSSGEIQQVRTGSWRIRSNNNIIHPVDIDTPSPAATPTASPVVYRDVKYFKKWRPWLVLCFTAANTIMFIVTMYVNNCPKNSIHCIPKFFGRLSFQPFKENPLLGPSALTLLKIGALEVSRVVNGHQGWLLITCIWLHAGFFHLLLNMLSFLYIGILLEREFGFFRIGLLYLISGLGGSLMSALFIRSGISIGASGALFGLLGGMLSELITNWTIYTNKVPTLVTLLVIIVSNLAVGIFPHVDNFAHIGGFLSGFFLGFVVLIRPQYSWITQRYASPGIISTSIRPKYKTYQRTLWVVSLLLLIAGFTLGMVMLFRGVDANKSCSWCHYLSCVPTKKWSCNTKSSACITSQVGSQLNLTCSGNGKSHIYTLPDATSAQIRGLCSEICG